ncbi:MAG: hypothetical protein ACR2F2_05920, partial [Pyrinomonadaceae bacterium]
MNFRPVHQNLDTSFVNLSALIKYLRRRRFAGIVRVRLNNYEAEIHITDENQMNVREQDHLSGRIAVGEEALQRILIRSREPGGIVNVFQKVNDQIIPEKTEIKIAEKPVETSEKKPMPKVKPARMLHVSPEKTIKPESPQDLKLPAVKPDRVSPNHKLKVETETSKTKTSLPDFPFRLSNNVEAKAQKTKISSEQFQTLIRLFSEILGTVDKSLSSAKLNFPAAFSKACDEISNDYPFLKSAENNFRYDKGKITLNGQIQPNQFISSQLEALRR